MMKEKENNIDLRLALGDSTQSAETRLKVNKGVGANAGSRINMAFAASDPLSELVWSPDNGLSLRCADSTFAASKPLLLWNVAPKNLVLSLPEKIKTKEENDHNPSEEGHFVVVESSVNQNLEASPSKSWMELYKKKGKGKFLSDGHDSDNSHESVESCNSSAKGKRRMDPSESTIDIKRAKTNPEDNPAFTSPIKPDSSFMNWISNMVKGYRSDLPKENVQDIVVRGTGFHAMFQSICSPASRKPDLVLPTQLQIVPVNAAPMQGVHRNNKSVKNSALGNLWITRFSPKIERTENANRDDTDHSRFVSSEVQSTRNTLGNDHPNDLEALSDNAEESAANKEIPRVDHRNSLHELDDILPSTICKSPDEIASIFARRLDALKQISLSVTKGGTSSQTPTCLFCGKHGHELRYCSDTTESELEALLCNASSHASAVGSCLCIICFQLDHWANTCPKKSTSKSIPGRFKLNLAGSKAPPRMDSKLGENISERRQYFPICNLVGRKMEAVPEGMLDAIKRLRLSRVEILKCMNSCISLSYLNGFFIRIRVGKLEAGQVGTGYYVASITGKQLELPAKDTKKYIAVNVGGTQSLIGIQYVSNHDFLEDELVTWWCRTLETGAKVPSQGELKSKFEERMKLGFC